MLSGEFMKKSLIVCAAVMALIGTSIAGGEGWTSDFEAAKKQAAESKKDLLIDFTGSDWCGWCIKLVDEVFKHDAFKTGVKDTFVLVEIDFPKTKPKSPTKSAHRTKNFRSCTGSKAFPPSCSPTRKAGPMRPPVIKKADRKNTSSISTNCARKEPHATKPSPKPKKPKVWRRPRHWLRRLMP